MRSISPKAEKWAIGILGVVSLLLVVHLVFYNGVRAAPAAAAQRAAAAHPRTARASASAGLPADPALDLSLLEALEKRPMPKSARNPFEFPPPPAPKMSAQQGQAGPAGPPPPPPLPLHAIGYSQQAGQPAQAVVTDSGDIYVVHAGEKFGKRYTVVSLTPARVEIHDEITQQTVVLPIAP